MLKPPSHRGALSMSGLAFHAATRLLQRLSGGTDLLNAGLP